MYSLPYDTNDVEPRHYKLEWLSMVAAVGAALALLLVAYFINNQNGLEKVAFICIVVAGFTVALSLAAMLAHYYIVRQGPVDDCDAPPSYSDTWRKTFYSHRMSELQDPENTVSSPILPHSNPELNHHGSALHLSSSAHTGPSIPDFSPHSSHKEATPPSQSSATCHNQLTATGRSQHYIDESQECGNDDLPSYNEALQSMDLTSLQKLQHDIEVESD